MLCISWISFIGVYGLKIFSVTGFKSAPGLTNLLFWAILASQLVDATIIVYVGLSFLFSF
jgi:hypothetical protein